MNKLIGVYKITNKKYNNIYIGISVDIKRRWKEHKNNYNKQLSKEYFDKLIANESRYLEYKNEYR